MHKSTRFCLTLLIVLTNTLFFSACEGEKGSKEQTNPAAGDATGTIEELMKQAEQSPPDPELLTRIATIALQSGDTSLSLHYLERSISADPGQSAAPFLMASIYAGKKDSTWKKIADNLISRTDDPIASAKGYFIYGVQWANENKKREAMSAFDKAINLHFTFSDAYIEKAILLYDEHRSDEAIDLLFKAQQIDGRSADIPYWLGECFLSKNDNQKARSYFELCLSLDPDYQSARDKIAKIKP